MARLNRDMEEAAVTELGPEATTPCSPSASGRGWAWHCRPLATSVREVVRVLAPGGSPVTVSHVWAIEKRSSVADGAAAVPTLLRAGGMTEVTQRAAPFRSGPGLVLRAQKPLDRNPIAP